MNTSRFREHLPPPSTPSNTSHSTSEGLEKNGIIEQIHQACSAPSPLISSLRNPALVTALFGGPTYEPDRKSGSHHSRSSRSSSDSTVFKDVLTKVERQANDLKSLLREAARRLREAEDHIQRLLAQLSAAKSDKGLAEAESSRLRQDAMQSKLRIETLEREIKRLQSDNARLVIERRDADETTALPSDNSKGSAPNFHSTEDYARRVGMQKWYIVGHRAGYEEGFIHATRGTDYERGYEDGQKDGWEEGWEEGLQQGLERQRTHAIEAFDQFVKAELRPTDFKVSR